MGLEGNPEDIFVPGVAVFSQRAIPLAAWTNGLDLAGMKADTEQGSLILETGVNTQVSAEMPRQPQDSTLPSLSVAGTHHHPAISLVTPPSTSSSAAATACRIRHERRSCAEFSNRVIANRTVGFQTR